MAERINRSARVIAVGQYQFDILAPARANGAKITVTREAGAPWPVGDVFTYRIYERDRDASNTRLLAQATERGSGIEETSRGVRNPPLVITLRWPVDRDRDLIRVELDVLQAFRAAFVMEYIS
jgi:hypothetical protein